MSGTTVAASRKHVELSLELKRKLIQEHEHGVPFTLLGKKYHIATSTAANIWRKKEFFLRSRMSGSRKRCNDRSKYKIVNQVTALFVKSMLERNHKIDGEVIKRFARTAAAQCNFKDFHGSNGWLDSFKKRENVCWVRRRGERAVAAAAAAAAAASTGQNGHSGQLTTTTGPLQTNSLPTTTTGANTRSQLTDQTHQGPGSSTAGAAATSLAIANLASSQLRRSDSPNLSTAAAAAAVAASSNQHDHHHHHHHHNHNHHHNHHRHNHFGHGPHHHDHLQRQASFDDHCQCPSSSSGPSAHCCWEEEASCPRCTVAAAAAAIAALNSSDSIHERDHEIEDWFHGIPFLCQFFEEYQNMHQQPQQQEQQQQPPQQQPQHQSNQTTTTSYKLDNFDQSRHLVGPDLYSNCLQPAPTIEPSGTQNRSPSSSSSSSSSTSSSSTSISSMSSMAATSTPAAAGTFHGQAKSQYQHAQHCQQQANSCQRPCSASHHQRGNSFSGGGAGGSSSGSSSSVAQSAACSNTTNTTATSAASESQTNLLMEDHQMFVVSSDLAQQQQQQQQHQQYHRHSSSSEPTLTSPFRSSSSSADVQSTGLQQTVLEADGRRQVRTMSADMLSDLADLRQQQSSCQQQRYATTDNDQHLNQTHEQQTQYQTDYSMATINGDQLMEVNYQETTGAGPQEESSTSERLADECTGSRALNSVDSCLRVHSFKSEPDGGVGGGGGHHDGGCCSSSSCSSLNHQQIRFTGPNAGDATTNSGNTSNNNNLNGANLNQSNSNDSSNNQTSATDRESLVVSIMSKTDYNSDDQEFYMNQSENRVGEGDGQADATGHRNLNGCSNTLDELSDNQDCCSDHLDSELAVVGRCCDNQLQAFRNGTNVGGGHNRASCYMDEYEYENISTIRHYPLPMTASSLQSLEDNQQQQFNSSNSMGARGGDLVGANDQQQRPPDQTSSSSPSSSSYAPNSVIASTGHPRNSRVSTTDENNDSEQYQMGQQQQQQTADYDPLGLVLYENEQTIEHADHEEHNLLHNALMRSPEKLKLIDSIITLLNYASNYNQKMLTPLLEIKRCIERDLEVVLSDTNSSSQQQQQQQCCNPTPTLKQRQQQQQHQDLISASYVADSSRQQQQVAGADEQGSGHEVSAMEMIVGEI